jgi:hypothetical protein
MDAQIVALAGLALLLAALLFIRFRSKLTWGIFAMPTLFAVSAAASVFAFKMTETIRLGDIQEELSAYRASLSMLDWLIHGLVAFSAALTATLFRRKIMSGLRRLSSPVRPMHAAAVALACVLTIVASSEILQKPEITAGYDRNDSEKFSDELQSFVGKSEEKVMVELQRKGYADPPMKISASWWSVLWPPYCVPQQFTIKVAMEKTYIIDVRYDAAWCADWFGKVIWISGKVSHPGSVFH